MDAVIVVIFWAVVGLAGLRFVGLILGSREKPREVNHTLGGWERNDPMNDPIPDAPQRPRVCTGLCVAMRGGELTRGETLGNAIARERAPEHVYRETPAPQRVHTPAEMPIQVEIKNGKMQEVKK